LQRSIPLTGQHTRYFNGAHQILPLDLTSSLSRYQYFAVSYGQNISLISIVRFDSHLKFFDLYRSLPEVDVTRMAVYKGSVSPNEKRTFFAAAGIYAFFRCLFSKLVSWRQALVLKTVLL